MKTDRIFMASMTILALVCEASSQVFNSGSSGALGDVVIPGPTNVEWSMPDNGEFHLNSLIVGSGATLTFRKPASGLNPPVYLLSRSNIAIYGTISVDGQPGQQGGEISPGGPGGFAGGSFGNFPNTGKLPGDGYGPGRGITASSGSFGTGANPNLNNLIYGSLPLLPLIGGSGGGGCDSSSTGGSGGGGGGAILIASDTVVTNNGFVSARGGSSYSGSCASGGGSGGAVRIVAPAIIGSGFVDVSSGSGAGGAGRIRFDCKTNSQSISKIGVWSVGRNPLIYIPNPPQLDVIQAAGVTIPPGSGAAFVTLPPGSSAAQTVTLQARNFAQTFQAWMDVTPESGPSTRTNFIWQAGSFGVGTTNLTNLTVVLPTNSTPTRITVWADYSFRFDEH